jgi:hypothetical protein
MGFTNFVNAPTTFQVTIATPFVGGSYDTLLSRHESTATDNRDGSVTVVPMLASGTVHAASVDLVLVPGSGLGDGCTAQGSVGISVTCDPLTTTFASVATGASGILRSLIAFQVSADDAFSTSGRVELMNAAAVPEPATMSLLGVGLAALRLARRRRREHEKEGTATSRV